jgi:hypothetical protein
LDRVAWNGGASGMVLCSAKQPERAHGNIVRVQLVASTLSIDAPPCLVGALEAESVTRQRDELVNQRHRTENWLVRRIVTAPEPAAAANSAGRG